MALSYTKTFQDDIFFFLPMTVPDEKASRQRFEKALSQLVANPPEDTSGYGKIYCDKLTAHIEYECENPTFRTLERYYLGQFLLACYDDDYDKYNEDGSFNEEAVLDTEVAHLFLTIHRKTGLCMTTIAIPDNHYVPTQLIDQMSTKNLDIRVPGREGCVPVGEYMAERFGMELCGDFKCVICLSNEPEDQLELAYMMAGETYVSEHIDYHLHEDRVKPLLQNHACYDYYSSYISHSVVAFVMNSFDEDLWERLDGEASVLFIVGIVMFQNTAVLRTNARVVEELGESDGITNQEIEKLYLEFGQTMKFWSTNIYKYPFSQLEAEEVIHSFGIDRALEDYHRNQAFLDRLIELRGTIVEERSSDRMNLILYLLTCIETISILLGGINEMLENPFVWWPFVRSVGLIAAIAAVCILIYSKFIKGRK